MAIIEPNFPKSPFIPVPESIELNELMEEALKTGAILTLWTKKREFLFENLKLISFSPANQFEIETKMTPELARFLDQSKRAQEFCYFTYGLWRCGVFFTAILETQALGSNKVLLRFSAPKDFYKVQRRSTFRLPIKAPYLLLAEIKLPGVLGLTQRKITDISIGGLAILTSPTEAEYFQKGRAIAELRITIRNRQIVSGVEIRHSRLINKETLPQLIVGLRLLNTSKKDLQLLDRFITEEAKTLFIGFVKR